MRKFIHGDDNEAGRQLWLTATLSQVPAGWRILDAGAGELQNKPKCAHLKYVSQDICQYDGSGDKKGLQTGTWDTSRIDLVCDIANVPEPDASFDAVLCSEVFEHLPDPLKALDEFSRLLRPGGRLILTAPFGSLVHFAPYHYATGFSRYWYELHLPERNFKIDHMMPNGDWFSMVRQELLRLPGMARRYGDRARLLAWLLAGMGVIYFWLSRRLTPSDDVACFGWHCVATRNGAGSLGA